MMFKMFILTVMIQAGSARNHSLHVEPFENPCYAAEKGMSGVSVIDKYLNIEIVTRARCVPDDGSPPPDMSFNPREIPPELLVPRRPPVRKGYPEDYPPRPCDGDPILDMLPGHCRK